MSFHHFMPIYLWLWNLPSVSAPLGHLEAAAGPATTTFKGFYSDSVSVSVGVGLEASDPHHVRPVPGGGERLHQRVLRGGRVAADREPSRDPPPQVCPAPDVQVRGSRTSTAELQAGGAGFHEDLLEIIMFRCSGMFSSVKAALNSPRSDNLILRLAKAAGEVLGKTHDELMYAFGVYMVKRIGNYGYERILKVNPRPGAGSRNKCTDLFTFIYLHINTYITIIRWE